MGDTTNSNEPNMAEKKPEPPENMKVSLYGKLLARHYGIFFGVFTAILVSFIVINVILMVKGYDILPLVFDDLPLDLHNDDYFLRFRAWENRDGTATQKRKKRSLDQDYFTHEEDMTDQLRRAQLGLPSKTGPCLILPISNTTTVTLDYGTNCNQPGFGTYSVQEMADSLRGKSAPHILAKTKRRRKRQTATTTNERVENLEEVTVTYQSAGGNNLITKENLQAIKAFEDELTTLPGHEDYCRTYRINSTHIKCYPPASITRFFDPYFVIKLNNVTYNDPNMDDVQTMILAVYNTTSYLDELLYFLGGDTKIDFVNKKIETARLRMKQQYGYPMKEYVGTTKQYDWSAQQKRWMKVYGSKVLRDFFTKSIKQPLSGTDINVLYFNQNSYYDLGKLQVFIDFRLIVGGVISILIICWFLTNSLFITLMGIFSILCSFAGANLIYRLLFDYRFFGVFNVLVVFVILGIGVDDMLIYVSTWRHYVKKDIKDLEVLTSVVFRKAAMTMFFTSLSTMVAFFVNVPSPMLSISGFGAFAGLCVLVNYICVVTFIPSVVLLYHNHFDRFLFLCCGSVYGPKKKKNKNRAAPRVQDPNMPTAWSSRPAFINRPYGVTNDPFYSSQHGTSGVNTSILKVNPSNMDPGVQQSWFHGQRFVVGGEDIDQNILNEPGLRNRNVPSGSNSTASLISDDEPVRRRNDLSDEMSNATVKFLSGKFFTFISDKMVAHIMIVSFLIITALACITVSRIQLGDSDIPLFKREYHMEKARIQIRDDYLINPYDDVVKVSVVWGLKLQDLTTCNRLHYSFYKCAGKTVYDKDFDLTDPTAQQQLLDWCTDIYNANQTFKDEMGMATKIETNRTDIDCFIFYMQQFFVAFEAVSGLTDVQLPMTKEKFQKIMRVMPDVFRAEYIDNITRPFELAFDFFINNAYSGQAVTDARAQLKTVMRQDLAYGDETPNIATQTTGSYRTIQETKLKYAALQIKTVIPAYTGKIDKLLTKMNKWEKFVNTNLGNMNKGVRNGFQLHWTWAWVRTLDVLVLQSGIGLAISLGFAFLIILFGTGNIISSVAILFLLASVTLCCLALVTLASWKFSMLEAINMCIVVGLAVDYVVHLAESYHLSVWQTRDERLRDALERIGLPILAGALTTLVCAFYMLFAQIIFFIQFGAFLFCTLGFAIVFTLFIMTSFYALWGPEGGNFDWLIKIVNKLRS